MLDAATPAGTFEYKHALVGGKTHLIPSESCRNCLSCVDSWQSLGLSGAAYAAEETHLPQQTIDTCSW